LLTVTVLLIPPALFSDGNLRVSSVLLMRMFNIAHSGSLSEHQEGMADGIARRLMSNCDQVFDPY
jgi:hypothetical protein